MTLWPTRTDPRLGARSGVLHTTTKARCFAERMPVQCRIVRCVEPFGNEVGSHSVLPHQHDPSRPPERPWLDDVSTTCAFPDAWVLLPGSMEATKRDDDNRFGC
jgi:hypothetical protein